ncbi:MAG: ABC transporter ATP-binding protein [Lysobacter sp.]|nr:ABC transporter ATP-binding protein [Lysobacter sp.]
MLVSAFAEVVSLGLLLPFLGVLTAPERVLNHSLVREYFPQWQTLSAGELALPLTLAFITAVVVSAAIRMLLLWSTTRFSLTAGVALSCETYRKTLYQPYLVHLARNSSSVISGLTFKINSVVFGVMSPILVLISSVVLLVSIVSTLVVIDPVVAVLAAAVLAGSYGVITWLSRRKLARNSHQIAVGQTQLVKTLQDGLGGIRDVLLDGTQPVYCEIYRQAEVPLRQAQCNNTFISQSPRFVMEALGMILIAALAYGMSLRPGGVAAMLPVLGALALGAQRLLPALQQAYSAWQSIAGNRESLVDVIELLDQSLPEELLRPAPAPMEFHHDIRFEQLKFRYAPEAPWVVAGLDLTIPKGARVGFVGSTGSGKSTSLDLLMGLLVPTAGRVLVDGQVIGGSTVRAWQRTIAHVPQSIYLADATLAENIAFGVPRAEVDMERVRQAARQAQIADFIETGSEGYDAAVGERGVRLSGGQRQRIGIARALYKQASVLVFDEATSALDNATEQSVMNTIEGLNRDLTIILIAHRLTTVQRCDMIVELEHGRVVAIGTYDELLEVSPSFRNMVNLDG